MIGRIKKNIFLILISFSAITYVGAVEKMGVNPTDTFTRPTTFKQELFSYNHSLGEYTVDILPTLKKISKAGALKYLPLKMDPYFQKVFTNNGDARFTNSSSLLKSNKLYEFTVFPTEKDKIFVPNGICKKIEKFTPGKKFSNVNDHPSLRGTVRILTDYWLHILIYKNTNNSAAFVWYNKNYATLKKTLNLWRNL